MTAPLLSPVETAWLRDAFRRAGYDRAGLTDRLGPDAVSMCGAVPTAEAARHSTGGDPLDILIRLFLCGATVPAAAARTALGPAAPALVERHGDGVRAAIEIHPYQDWWIVADVRPQLRPDRATPPDFVMCAGPVSTGLADSTVRQPVATALDLGTGNGVQALHLSGQADHITATDLSARALRFAATTAALNGLDWELLAGDLAVPVEGRRFDLVVSNPPFVVGPGRTHLLYQDSGRPGDRLAAELAAVAPDLLTEGGTMQYITSWVHVRGEEWAERVRSWVPPGLDAWVIQGSVADPVTYVDGWLAQSHAAVAPEYRDEWLAWFDTEGIEAVGTGIVSLRRTGAADPAVRVEDLRQEVDKPFGTHVRDWFDRRDWLRTHDLLDACLASAEGLSLWQAARQSDGGWRLRRQILAQTAGLHRADDADPLVVNLVGACDGTRPLREVLKSLAAATDADEAALTDAALPLVPELVERGFLRPADAAPRGGVSPSG